MDVLVTYDIRTPDPEGQRRLNKIAAICERYGERLQYSVFGCRLSDVKLIRLVAELEDAMDHTVDSIDIYRFNGSITESRTTLGHRRAREPGTPWIVNPRTPSDP